MAEQQAFNLWVVGSSPTGVTAMSATFLRWKNGVAVYEVDCLGWCHKKIVTDDPAHIRYCNKCRRIKENAEVHMSRIAKNIGDGIRLPGLPSNVE